MFVLDELERLLDSDRRERKPTRHDKAPLKEIQRVDVARSLSLDRVKFRDINMDNEPSDHQDSFDLKAYISNRNYLTLDVQFAHLMKKLVLDRLAQIPERPYPASRLMICDVEAHKNLLKFQHVMRRLYPNPEAHRFLLQRPPFGVTAILLLKDVVDLIRAVGRPIAVIKNERSVNFDYSIIKQTFPFLKITDLIIVLDKIGDLKLGTFTMNGTAANQTIQLLAHFARSAHLVELSPIGNKLGGQHPLFDNVSVLKIPNYSEFATQLETGEKTARMTISNAHLEPTLLQLSFIAHRLQELINQLEWHLDSVTFRLGDPNGFSKIFSQIINSIDESEASESTSERSMVRKNLFMVPARVLVLDRFFDFHGLLRHTDLYGPFLEQENSHIPKGDLNLDECDELDVTLQSVNLTDALKVILEQGNKTTADLANRRANRSSRTHAIRRHLDIVKSIYKSLCGGYLLTLKLEAGLGDIMQMIRTSKVDLTNDGQAGTIIERIERIVKVFEQLFSIQDNYLDENDMIRVAMLLLDTINVVIYLSTQKSVHFARLNELKSTVKERTIINVTNDRTSNGRHDAKHHSAKQRASKTRDKLDRFDATSQASCSHRATSSLEEIIEQFYHRKLDQKSYPRLKRPAASHGLAKNVSRNKVIVLVLGSLSYDELTRIKSLERKLMQGRRRSKMGDIVVMCSDIVRPNDFVQSL